MRLLLECEDGKFMLTGDLVRDIPSYAILSHTWGPDDEEVTYRDLVAGTGEEKIGYKKIRFCAAQAKRDGLQYFWVDTCCIDKSDNSELSKAINSMFRWYQNAARCYVYLSDISASGYKEESQQQARPAWESAFRASKWFTRGWTLQELLAPKSVEFFTKDGRRLGNKRSLEQQIHEITGVAISALRGSDLAGFDIDERFKWAETRQTTHEEDWAYCLLGIFSVFMPLIYGEGKAHAVRRLRKEIADATSYDDAPNRRGRELSEKEEKYHQIFRLTSGDKDTTYEWYKDSVEARVDGTCQWFLSHNHFQRWLEQESGPLLVSADPGCGKSVLAKYLVDHVLPRSATICYFFFKDQDQNTVRQALCALLHQLFSQKPPLLEHVMAEYSSDGIGLVNATASLWRIFDRAVRDPQAGAVIIVLDALDECAELEFKGLIQNVKRQFHSNQLGDCKLKFLLTSRPYDQIVSEFRDLLGAFPYVYIPGEEKSEAISQEVNLVIKYRANRLAEEKRLSDSVKDHLTKKLLEISHRTYLWVYLVFHYLKTEGFKKTEKGIESAIRTLPKTVNDAYEQILTKSKNLQGARKALAIILAARRPLTLAEMNIAINIQDKYESFYDLDLEEDEDFKSNLRSWCGLFISIYHGKVYFLHQTAREFLLADLSPSTAAPSEQRWHRSITTRHAHTVLAEQCVLYLNLFNSAESSRDIGGNAFLDYSAKNWGFHFREADIPDNAPIIPSALRICNPDSVCYSAWFWVYWDTTPWSSSGNWTSLFIPSHFGHEAVVKLLLATGNVDADLRDDYGWTPLSWAAEGGHEAVVKLLLATGKVDAESKTTGRYTAGRTPLSQAAEGGHEAVVKLLLAIDGVDADSKDEDGWTPLSRAANGGHEAVVKLLLAIEGVDADVKDEYGWTPLSRAAEGGHEAVIKLLLATGKVDADSRDKSGRTPLSWAATNGHEAIVKLLLVIEGVDADSRDKSGRTPLSQAAEGGHEAIVELLLAIEGVDADSRDNEYGRPPLSRAAAGWHELFVNDSRSSYGRTPLSWAAEGGHEAVVKLLLAIEGVDADSRDNYGRTPLSRAAANGREAVVKLLLAIEGVNADSRDNEYGRTPLSWAAMNGHEAVVKLLLAIEGINANSRDNEYGQTPLSWAATNGHEAVVKLLLAIEGVDADSRDNEYDRTPLSWAARYGHEAVVKLLLAIEGVDADSRDKYGWTPLSQAAANGREAVVKLLLAIEGVNADSRDNEYGRTPLSWAAENGHEAVVELLRARLGT